jgi:nicotinamidase/pyrazinamidase
MNCLLLVDIQNDFFENGALAVPDASQILDPLNKVLNDFELVIATQDWHPANHRSFASNNLDVNVGDLVEIDGLQQIMWPDHCIQNSFGAMFHSNLNTQNITKVFQKGCNINVDSYSGFYDNAKRGDTGLKLYLDKINVKKLYIAGLATDYCVKFTALDAVACGYNTFLLSDCCRAVNLKSDDEQDAINLMRDSGVVIMDSSML